MPDNIELLPELVANQIAAGEVIQRPASVVKELLENSIDAGSNSIKLIVKEAGKALIQVVDDGCGMSERDAEMSLERHATSKIRKAEDLFSIHTKGFRGEALASIFAIAHLEIKTRTSDSDVGLQLIGEGGKTLEKQPCQCQIGTSFSVKNLFYNVPARRNFLKSNPVELKHIIEEFQRVSIAHPNVSFTFHHDGNEVFNLPAGQLRQRLVHLLGKKYNQRLVPVSETTEIVTLEGFIGKPEFAKRTRGEQYLFVNNRFIKSAYLNHAISSAFEGLVSHEQHPAYFLFMTIDPQQIDINIHPTKTEVKFQDEKSLYAIVHSAIKQALGKHNLTPTIDFNQETSFNIEPPSAKQVIKSPDVHLSKDYNPFNREASRAQRGALEKAAWQQFYQPDPFQGEEQSLAKQKTFSSRWEEEEHSEKTERFTHQILKKYIVTSIASGLIVVHQQRAHERILFERYLAVLERNEGATQQELFPQQIELSAPDTELIDEITSELRTIGFDLEKLGNRTFSLNGIPVEAKNQDAKSLIEHLLEHYKSTANLKFSGKEKMAQAVARSMSIRVGKKLASEEMNHLIDELFACKMPYFSIQGKPTILTFKGDELDKRFES